jgi:cell shape-determining protein MreC
MTRLPSKRTTFWTLIAASILTALLPAVWTVWVRGLLQPLLIPQRLFTAMTQRAVRLADHSSDPPRSVAEIQALMEERDALQRENEALTRALGHEQLRLGEAEERLGALTGLPEQLPDSNVQIVIAPIIAYDSSPSHETIRIQLSARQSEVVAVGQWVMAGAPEKAGTDARVAYDRQWLIGRVTQVLPHLASVQLVTDRAFRGLDVQFARPLSDGTWERAEETGLLTGAGQGMRIEQATQDFYTSGYKVVVAVSRGLPFPLTVGRLTGSNRRTDSSQHFDLSVAPWASIDKLTYVFVLAPKVAGP